MLTYMGSVYTSHLSRLKHVLWLPRLLVGAKKGGLPYRKRSKTALLCTGLLLCICFISLLFGCSNILKVVNQVHIWGHSARKIELPLVLPLSKGICLMDMDRADELGGKHVPHKCSFINNGASPSSFQYFSAVHIN